MNDNNITKNNKKLAGWIEDFVANFAKTNQEREIEATKETVAEININDLDKVVWNDETFYVYFDETGASIINVFGNMVTTLDGIMTLEEVNQQLNSKQIVSSTESELVVNAEMENEIEKALLEIEVEADVNDEQAAQEYVETYNDQTTQEQPQQPQDTTQNEQLVSTGLLEFEALPLKEYDEKTAELINNKLAEMEERLVNSFEEKMNSMMEQLYARMNPGDIYDMGEQVQKEEISKFTDEAVETEQQIAEENSMDRTLVDNRYSTEDNSEFENPEITEEINVDNVVEDQIEEVEDVVEEVNLENDIEVFEESEAEEITEVTQPVEENEVIELEELEEVEEVETEEVETEEVDGIEIEGDDAEVFKTAKCPYCSGPLSKVAMKSNSIDINCDSKECAVKYRVSLNNGKIYLI